MNKKFHLLIIIIITLSLLCSFSYAQGLSSSDIQSSLTGYEEPGYKFIEKTDDNMWKVLYSRPGWDFGWEVIITATNPNPENSFIVIGTTVTSTENMSYNLMLALLDENSFDTNPGSFSIFKDGDTYTVQYAIKIPQTLMNKNVLIEAIGFVAGYSNSKYKKLEYINSQESSGSGSK